MMPFPYSYVCDLLQKLDDEARSCENQKEAARHAIEEWFSHHRIRLDAPTVSGSALLSTLLPERRSDRVYNIQAPRLQSIIGQALMLGKSRVKELRRWTTPGLGADLGDCVESILNYTPNSIPKGLEVTVEEVDEVLARHAAKCRFSSPAVRAAHQNLHGTDDNFSLASLYRRLSARDAKWLTRLVLKNYQPVVMEDWVVLHNYHFLLPRALKVRDNLEVAIAALQHINNSETQPGAIASLLKPALGTKVGRQPWIKGRSIKHCVDMMGGRLVSCERKIDGEYCQIHVDPRNRRDPIQIFSKSGKDSTRDREGLHQTIRESLKLGKQDCPLRTGCIVEGELVVYSEKDHKILPFHKIRKHVSRSGSFLGTKNDSQAHGYEHLMIIYYDVLMVDDESFLGLRQSERFKRLKRLVTCRRGHAELVQRQVISFSQQDAPKLLREAFAQCIVARGEGLVLKPDDPYFDFALQHKRYGSCSIKLKKEYVAGFGDVGDFAVIGASYDAVKAKTYNTPNLKWTHFYIGCLENRDRVLAKTEKPQFVVTNIVELNETQMKTARTHCSSNDVSLEDNEAFELNFEGISNAKKPIRVFLEPWVFDMRCFSFDKEANSRSWSMRFPMVSKIHFDRSWRETMSFEELQESAQEAMDTPEQEDSQEMRQWVAKLEKADPRGVPMNASSQETTFTDVSQSPEPHVGIGESGSHLPLIHEDFPEVVASLRPSDGIVTHPLLPTPPPSSAAQTTTPPHEVLSSAKLQQTPSRPSTPKRPRDTMGVVPERKRARLHSGGETDPVKSRESAQPKGRQPLGPVNVSTSGTVQVPRAPGIQTLPRPPAEKLMPPFSETDIPSSMAASSHTPVGFTSSAPGPNPHKAHKHGREETLGAPRAPVHQVTGCLQRGPKCFFANHTLILSPCISGFPWVTDNLLRGHGITEYATEPETWSKELKASSTLGYTSCPSSDGSAKRFKKRKMCLVDGRRSEATHAFLQRIEKAGLRRRNEQREWVAVYDWRLLEDIAHVESGLQNKGGDIMKRWWVGLA